jgi:hypothetical protein
MSATPGAVRWAGRPRGADNDLIYQGRLGLSAADVAQLAAIAHVDRLV